MNFTQGLYETLIPKKGWRHLLIAAALVYFAMYWGNNPDNFKSKLWYDDMLVSLARLGAIKYFIYTIVTFFLACIFEIIQAVVLRSKNSMPDAYWSAIGAPLAFLIYHIFPQSQIAFWVSVALLIATATLFIWWLYVIRIRPGIRANKK